MKVEALFGMAETRCLFDVPKDEGRVLDMDEQRVVCDAQCSEQDLKSERSHLVFDSGTVLASLLDPGNSTPRTFCVLAAAAERLAAEW